MPEQTAKKVQTIRRNLVSEIRRGRQNSLARAASAVIMVALWPAAPALSIVLFSLLSAQPLAAQTLGMVADDATDSVTIFDADSDTVLGSVAVPSGQAIGDCSITPDQALGFVTNFQGQVSVIDLTALSWAPGINPIPISNNREDTSITPDGGCVVVCDGSLPQPVSSIDIASRAQVDTVSLGSNCNSVDVCSDGTVLATSTNGLIHRLTIDGSCMLTDTGDSISTGGSTNNVTCAPDAASLVASNWSPSQVRSFTTPPLAGPVSVQSLSGSEGLSAAFSPDGGVLYARSNNAVDAFDYAAGVIGPSLPGFPISAGYRRAFYGMEQLALHPNGSKLYVPNPGSLDIFDANTGVFIKSIVDSAISSPTGVCFSSHAICPVIDALDDEFSVINDGTTADLLVLANDECRSDAPISVVACSLPDQGGSCTIDGDKVRYTPAAGFVGLERFTYTAQDAGLEGGDDPPAVDQDTATVVVDVLPDEFPDAVDDVATTLQDQDVIIDVLENDSLGNAPNEVAIETAPANGSATLQADNTIQYSPNFGFFGDDSFEYRLTDANGDSDVATVTVCVFGGGQLPIDIMPSDPGNNLNLRAGSGASISVAVLSASGICAAPNLIDPLTLEFGPGQAGISGNPRARDVDGDGDKDLIVKFLTNETGIACGDTEASLSGRTFDSLSISGSDATNTFNCPRNRKRY